LAIENRPARALSRESLLRFCGQRTPCHSLWIEIKDVLVARDKRGVKKYIFAWGFALGVRWALMQSAQEHRELRDTLNTKAEAYESNLRHRSKLNLLD
jgi:hypothetical protein